MNYHFHQFEFKTENYGIHQHKISDYTEGMVGINSFHFHFFYGISSYDGHTHYFSGHTGLPIKTENGHIHKMEGALEVNNFHEHKYAGHTFEEISYIPTGTVREAMG
ncbi:MAG: YmaF family protein [Clostridia bacterium]|nr:YmaF family protein [Clostridia bacterium]